jgi:hypothetical protein
MAERAGGLRTILILGLLTFLWPLHASAQDDTGYVEPNRALSPQPELHVERLARAAARWAPIAGWLERAAQRDVPRLKLAAAIADSAFSAVQQPPPRKRSWIGRHPALFGALVGFGGGFLAGYLPGSDGVFDDQTAGFNGWVLGGVGAGAGALAGAFVGAATK